MQQNARNWSGGEQQTKLAHRSAVFGCIRWHAQDLPLWPWISQHPPPTRPFRPGFVIRKIEASKFTKLEASRQKPWDVEAGDARQGRFSLLFASHLSPDEARIMPSTNWKMRWVQTFWGPGWCVANAQRFGKAGLRRERGGCVQRAYYKPRECGTRRKGMKGCKHPPEKTTNLLQCHDRVAKEHAKLLWSASRHCFSFPTLHPSSIVNAHSDFIAHLLGSEENLLEAFSYSFFPLKWKISDSHVLMDFFYIYFSCRIQPVIVAILSEVCLW